MSKGACLCGKITWQFDQQPEAAYHCHCAMCRKAHAAAFASYYLVKREDFNWTGSQDSVKEYKSSDELTRCFCNACGSVVPNGDSAGELMYVPAGSHTDGPSVESHIFVASKAPWYDITDTLPKHDVCPPGDDYAVCEDKKLTPQQTGVVRGSCLCDAVQFEITEPFKAIHNCHCSRCRRARAAAHTTNGFIGMDGIRFIQGESNTTVYSLPEAKFFTHAFCNTCGSGTPRIDQNRKIAIIPMGALDDDPGVKPDDHIFVSDKADWDEITGDLPAFEKMPA